MLNLLISILILLFIPKISKLFWFSSAPILIIVTFLSLIFSPQFQSLLMISSYSSLDQISFILIILTLWITSLIFQARISIFTKKNNPQSFLFYCVILLFILVMCFSSSNLLIFYVWFESSLIPTIILIILWGYQPERVQARIYLILYTVTASLPLLIIICSIYLSSKHLLISYPWITLPLSYSPIIAVIITLAFLVKLPLFLVHLWLPKAHVEAPVAGSIILAAILLKLGGYGLLRILILFPRTVKLLNHHLIRIALIGGIATRLICLRQSDIKSIIAYSSVGHMGLICVGAITNSSLGLLGAFAIIVAHAFRSSALFCICNITYEFSHTRNLALIKGLLSINPIISIWWFLLVSINIAAPPSINLLREILLISASVAYSLISILPIIFIRFLTVAYSLYIYSRINHGHPLTNTNPFVPLKPNHIILVGLHFTPAILLIMSPSLLTLWL
jgi:NADH-ubiquinone oxidoreductase chain 4